MFIAHRGNGNHKYRENSDKAILYSLEKDYISGIECDIRLTADKKIVLSHNSLMVDGSGFIHNMTLEKILNYTFDDGSKMTVLDELLLLVRSNKIILLEIKEEKDRIDDWVEVIYFIKDKFSNLNIYLCSFNYSLISALKKRFVDIPMGLIIGYVMNQKKDIASFDFVMYQYNSFRYTHKKSFVWTVNTKELYKEFKNKVDYIITDKAYDLL